MFGTYVSKYDAGGSQKSSINASQSGGEFSDAFSRSVAMAVDGGGNIYGAFERVNVNSEKCSRSNPTNVVAKYSTTGVLQWQRTSTVGTLKGNTVSSSGSVYVVGSAGLACYTNSGSLTWTTPVTFEEVIVSGSNLHTCYRKEIRKYDGTGKQL